MVSSLIENREDKKYEDEQNNANITDRKQIIEQGAVKWFSTDGFKLNTRYILNITNNILLVPFWKLHDNKWFRPFKIWR